MYGNIKVIGRTKDGFIVECPEDTLYYLTGQFKHETEKPLQPGDEVQLGELFLKLRSIRSNKSNIENAIGQLESIIESITLIDPIVTEEGLKEASEGEPVYR